MRTGATQDFTHNPYVKIVVGGDTYTTADATPRIISATTDEQIYGGRYTITFYNGDDFFNTVPAKAYEGLPLDLYFGFSTTPVTGSYLGTLIVEKQSFSNKRKTFILTCFDSIGKLSLHQGSVGGSVWNHPSQTLTALGEVVLPSGEPLPAALITAINAQYDKTAWQIIQTVVAATTGVTVNLVNDDTYIQVQKPLVNAGDARSVIIQALGATESYLRIKTNTANLDVIQPSALTGGNPAYTYNDSNYYWNDTDEKAVVVPNTIIYYGITVARALINTGATHGINQASIDLLGNIYEHNDYDPISRENSVTQAEVDAKADRRIAKLVLALGTGTVVAPMNCAQELFDKIIVTDTRYTPTKTITGYVSRIQREFGQGVYRITIELGGVETGYTPARGVEAKMMPSAPGVPPIDSTFLIPKAIQGYYHDIHFVADDYDTVSWLAGTIKFYDGTTQAVSAGNTGNLANTTLRYIYFDLNDVAPGTLKVTTDYLSVMTTKTGILCLIQKGSISGIKATVIPSYGKEPLITPDFIDMSGLKEYDYGSGAKLQAILSTQIQAGHILLSADTTFATGYDPTGKEVAIYRSASAPGDTSLLWFDTSVGLMKAYVSSAWKVLEGEWYRKTGVAIDATKGIALYGGQVALKTYPTLQNYIDDVNVQCYVGTDGKFYAGAGTVVLDSTGLLFYYGTPKVKVGSVYITDAYVGWLGESGISIILQTSGTADIYVGLTAGRALKPLAGSSIDLGTSALSWHNAYIDHIKNLTDPVDNQDAATKKYVDDSTSGYSDATQTDVTASRTFDVDGNHIYRNTSGKKRLVVITLGLEKSSGAYAHSSVGTPPTDVVATLDSALATGSWLERLLVFMVPKNYYYRVTGTGDSPTTIKWMEWEF